MPVYVFKCDHCGVAAERQRKIAEMDDPMKCPECGQDMRRVPTAPAKTPEKWR